MILDIHFVKKDVKQLLSKIKTCGDESERTKAEKAAKILLTFLRECINDSASNKIPRWLSSPMSLKAMILRDVKFGSTTN